MIKQSSEAFFEVTAQRHKMLYFIDETKAMSGAALKELKVRRPDVVAKLANWDVNTTKLYEIENHVFLVVRKHYRSRYVYELVEAAIKCLDKVRFGAFVTPQFKTFGVEDDILLSALDGHKSHFLVCEELAPKAKVKVGTQNE